MKTKLTFEQVAMIQLLIENHERMNLIEVFLYGVKFLISELKKIIEPYKNVFENLIYEQSI